MIEAGFRVLTLYAQNQALMSVSGWLAHMVIGPYEIIYRVITYARVIPIGMIRNEV